MTTQTFPNLEIAFHTAPNPHEDRSASCVLHGKIAFDGGLDADLSRLEDLREQVIDALRASEGHACWDSDERAFIDGCDTRWFWGTLGDCDLGELADELLDADADTGIEFEGWAWVRRTKRWVLHFERELNSF